MLLLNARSVKNKWHEIYDSICFYNAGIVAITETWLLGNTDFLTYSYMKHNKFVAYRRDRRGGVLCLVSDCYMAVELGKPSNWLQSCDGVIVKLSSIASVLVVVYRPPDCTCDDTEQLVNAFESVLSLGYHTTSLGDVNMPAID